MDINLNNYEEYLLSYVDKELDEEQTGALMLFLQAHPDKQKELELLQSTVLPAEDAPHFPGKPSLYREERPEIKKKKVFLLRRYTLAAVAAAACVALLVVFHLQSPRNTPGDGSPVAVNQPDSGRPTAPGAALPSPSGEVKTSVAVAEKERPKKNATGMAASGSKPVKEKKQVQKELAPAPAASEEKGLAANEPHTALPEISAPALTPDDSEAHKAVLATAVTAEPPSGPENGSIHPPAEAGTQKPAKAKTVRNAEVLESFALAKEDFDSTITHKLTDINEKASGFINKIAKNGIKIGRVTFAINN